MFPEHVVLTFLAFVGGVAVSAGTFAFLLVIGVVPRMLWRFGFGREQGGSALREKAPDSGIGRKQGESGLRENVPDSRNDWKQGESTLQEKARGSGLDREQGESGLRERRRGSESARAETWITLGVIWGCLVSLWPEEAGLRLCEVPARLCEWFRTTFGHPGQLVDGLRTASGGSGKLVDGLRTASGLPSQLYGWLSGPAEGIGHLVLGVSGLCAGIFVGCIAVSLAEIIDTFPILFRRTGLEDPLPGKLGKKDHPKLEWLLIAMAFGKLAGALWQFIFF